MPSVYDLKPKFQALLRPSMHAMANAGITPNAVTFVAILGSVAAGYIAAAYRMLWILPIWLFLRMALNAIDGMMARELKQGTHLGAVLNEGGDILSDAALYLPLWLIAPVAAAAIVAFTLGAVMTEFFGVLQQALTGTRRYEGPMGKSDRAFAIGLVALISAFKPDFVEYWQYVFWFLFALTVITCLNRLKARG